MGLFSSKELNSLDTLFLDQLQDLYDAEQRLTGALPKMADAANNSSLKGAFMSHLEETKGQISRLEAIFKSIGETAKGKTCEAMKGLVTEGEEVISATGDCDVKDAALIAAAQRVEHYEIAGYGTLRTFAQHLGHTEAVQLLQQTLDEEKAADVKLTKLAEANINVQAEQA